MSPQCTTTLSSPYLSNGRKVVLGKPLVAYLHGLSTRPVFLIKSLRRVVVWVGVCVGGGFWWGCGGCVEKGSSV